MRIVASRPARTGKTVRFKLALAFLFVLLTSSACLAQIAGSLQVHDTRSANEPPSAFNYTVRFDFKLRDAVSVPGENMYSTTLTVAPWGDLSGGRNHQLNFNDGGVFYRASTSDRSAWEGWRRLLLAQPDGGLNLQGPLYLTDPVISSGTGSRIILADGPGQGQYHSIGINDYWTEFRTHSNEGWRFISGDNGQVQLLITGKGHVEAPHLKVTNGAEVLGGLQLVDGNPNVPDNVLTSVQSGDHYNLIGTYPGWDAEAVYLAGYHAYNAGWVKTKRVRVGQKSVFNLEDGSLGLGTDNTAGYHLAVNGKVRAKEVRVESGWADFVFAAGYRLRPLPEVEAFIQEHGRLPEVPSAEEIQENGADLGKTDALLLQKIEELTLYLIEVKKENEELRRELRETNEKVNGLQNKKQINLAPSR